MFSTETSTVSPVVKKKVSRAASHQKKLAPRSPPRYRLGMAPKTPAPVAVSYRIRRETRDRIKRLADEHGLKIERLVDQLLTAALDLRERTQAVAS